MLRDFTSPFDATVVRLVSNAGAEIIGKTNCDEFGMGSLNIHSIHGPVVNPFQVESQRAAGGSSGGSAAAVAAGLCTAALGTDTGGSIRLPASYCGVVGFKPSYGLVSRYGVVSYADSLDTVGVLAQDVSQVVQVFEQINKYDYNDPTSIDERTRNRAQIFAKERYNLWNHEDLKGLRIGVPQEYFPSELSSSSNPILSSTRHVLSLLQSLGATICSVSLPSTKYALSAYYVIASAEASSCLSRYDGVQYGFGREVRKRILLGTYALSADAFDNYFLQAQRVRQLVRDDFDRVFSMPNVLYADSSFSLNENGEAAASTGIDVLIHPSAIRTAPPLEDARNDSSERDTLQDYVQDVLTVPASLAGLPALSIPMRTTTDLADSASSASNKPEEENWPIGISVVGQWGSDDLVMKATSGLYSHLVNPDIHWIFIKSSAPTRNNQSLFNYKIRFVRNYDN
ncbi:amidase signature domain-containing protein [Rhodocollybia butyracea]|uniref:Glutamyl-tRNA(Gln) amidotransferase subunit A, mitochondrial n=1 Tax=Rhodocollybia butyracea TaxID=206335 RepID=A0A9P5PUK5_9AGAR|nr:amidase signature domain-containing protein [Rhodocollybia butyracea]